MFDIVNRLLGTPTLDVWPGLAQMPDFRPQFPKWRPQNLSNVVTDLDQQGIHLLSRMLVYEAQRRISGELPGSDLSRVVRRSLIRTACATAKQALLHPYFMTAAPANSRPLGAFSPSSLLCAPNTQHGAVAGPNAPPSPSALMASPIN